MVLFILYLILVNIFGYIICWYDKMQAIHRKYRVSEKFLFAVAMVGGAFGIYLAMQIFRHKTKHRTFTTGIPLFGAVWLCVIAVVVIICSRR